MVAKSGYKGKKFGTQDGNTAESSDPWKSPNSTPVPAPTLKVGATTIAPPPNGLCKVKVGGTDAVASRAKAEVATHDPASQRTADAREQRITRNALSEEASCCVVS
jgi:hypothetical protein